MAKRFIDTAIFDDPWFMDLSKDAKIFWIYAITKCDHAGILELNEKLCKYQTGIDKKIETLKKELGNRLVTLTKPYIFIPKFLFFQYPNFPNSKVKAQQSAVERLIKFEVLDKDTLTLKEGLGKGYEYGYDTGSGNGSDNGNGIGGKEAEKSKQFEPPTLQEVKDYFEEWGYDPKVAERAYHGYDVNNWHDANGKKVKNWKQKMQQVWFREDTKKKNSQENINKLPDY